MPTLRLGDQAPNFSQQSTHGPIEFHAWSAGSWVVLFSHPADFTPVCTTELGRTAALASEFAKRGVKPIAVSVDPLEKHEQWIGDINDTQKTTVNFPILADADKTVATLYDMIHPNALVNATVRSVFIIDPGTCDSRHADLPRQHRTQFQRNPARHRFTSAHRQPQGRHPGGLARRW